MVEKITIKLALAVCITAFSFAAHAQVAPKTKTATVEVSATVDSNCEISANPLAFGKYDPLNAADTTATAAITLTCVKNTPVIGVDLSGLIAATGNRQMSNGNGTLDYQVYKAGDTADTPCTAGALSVWGVGNDALKPGIANDASAKNYNLCGVIKAGQDVGAGNYKDTLTATISY
jgi:spore coat protein U-like protein